MAEKNKEGVLDSISNATEKVFRENLVLTTEKIRLYLKSAIFYRSLYNFEFALRHRSEKSIERTIREIKQILNS